MSRTTITHVRGAFRSAVLAARACGVDTAGWEMREGSKPNGVTYVMVMGSRLVHLGLTRSEAWRSLTSMAEAWRMVAGPDTASVVALSKWECAYLARAVDVARGDVAAARYLDPVGRDELLKRLGGRE